jgi:hypothetical protein
VRGNVIPQVAEKISLDFVLEPGVITQHIEVQAEAPLLQPGSSNIGTPANTRTILDLPLEGRNVCELVATVPGTTPEESYGYTSGGSINLGGGPGIGLNQISINGVVRSRGCSLIRHPGVTQKQTRFRVHPIRNLNTTRMLSDIARRQSPASAFGNREN